MLVNIWQQTKFNLKLYTLVGITFNYLEAGLDIQHQLKIVYVCWWGEGVEGPGGLGFVL